MVVTAMRQLWIGGQWVSPIGGRTRQIVNPANRLVIATVAEAGADDVSRAVAAARLAFDEGAWRELTHRDRGQLLLRFIATLFARNRPRLRRLIVTCRNSSLCLPCTD